MTEVWPMDKHRFRSDHSPEWTNTSLWLRSDQWTNTDWGLTIHLSGQTHPCDWSLTNGQTHPRDWGLTNGQTHPCDWGLTNGQTQTEVWPMDKHRLRSDQWTNIDWDLTIHLSRQTQTEIRPVDTHNPVTEVWPFTWVDTQPWDYILHYPSSPWSQHIHFRLSALSRLNTSESELIFKYHGQWKEGISPFRTYLHIFLLLIWFIILWTCAKYLQPSCIQLWEPGDNCYNKRITSQKTLAPNSFINHLTIINWTHKRTQLRVSTWISAHFLLGMGCCLITLSSVTL